MNKKKSGQEKCLTVLLVEDDSEDRLLIKEWLNEVWTSLDFHLICRNTLEEGLRELAKGNIDVALVDLHLPDSDGEHTIERIHNHAPSVATVILSGLDNEDLALEAVRKGAQDYLIKNQIDGRTLVRVIRYAIERKRIYDRTRFLATAVNQSADAMVIASMRPKSDKPVISYVNPAFTEMTGYQSEDVVGKSHEFFPGIDRKSGARDQLQKSIRESGHYHGLLTNKRKNGEIYHIELDVSPVKSELGDITSYVVIGRDVTETKRLEEQQKHVFNLSVDLIAILGFDGHLKQVNPACEKTLGFTASEMLAAPFVRFIHVSDRATVAHHYANLVLQREQTATLEIKCLCRDGSSRYVHIKAVVVPELKIIYSIGRDVTDERRLKAELLEAQKMDSLGRLAGGVAHDFNNLLTIIKGYAEILTAELAKQDKSYPELAEIIEAGEHAARLTQQLLAFSKRQVIHPHVVDLNSTIKHMHGMMRRLIDEDIALDAKLSKEAAWIKVDGGQLTQVIMNVIVNARDAMPEGGRITVATRQVALEKGRMTEDLPVLAYGDYILLTIQDTGSGMTKETQSKVFEPFFTTKEKGKGTGLGLSVSYGIVRQCGGTIKVSSEEGRGTTVQIYFPKCVEGLRIEKKNEDKVELPRGSETVLVVEDEQKVRSFASTILRASGYRVLEAGNGREAWTMLEGIGTDADLVFSDVIMPEMDGKELAGRLRARMPNVKVLLTSGYTDDKMIQRGVFEGGINFVQKPYSAERLTTAIREVLDRGNLSTEKKNAA